MGIPHEKIRSTRQSRMECPNTHRFTPFSLDVNLEVPDLLTSVVLSLRDEFDVELLLWVEPKLCEVV